MLHYKIEYYSTAATINMILLIVLTVGCRAEERRDLQPYYRYNYSLVKIHEMLGRYATARMVPWTNSPFIIYHG